MYCVLFPWDYNIHAEWMLKLNTLHTCTLDPPLILSPYYPKAVIQPPHHNHSYFIGYTINMRCCHKTAFNHTFIDGIKFQIPPNLIKPFRTWRHFAIALWQTLVSSCKSEAAYLSQFSQLPKHSAYDNL